MSPDARPAEPELPGLEAICQALAAGAAAVVPNPFPMTYGVVATSARTVNAVKGRPLDQNVGVSLHDRGEWERVAPSIDLPPAALDAAIALLQQRFSLLLPVSSLVPAPDWVGPAVRDGYLAAFNGYWTETAPLWDRFPRLFGSSANVTGELPADSAARAAEMFGADCAVLEVPALEGHPAGRSASAMIRIDRSGGLVLHRPGAQSAVSGVAPVEYLQQLAAEVGLSDGSV